MNANIYTLTSGLDRAMLPLTRTGHDTHTARIVDTMAALDRAMAPVVAPVRIARPSMTPEMIDYEAAQEALRARWAHRTMISVTGSVSAIWDR